MITHKHHKIPRHRGGSDDPSNLIEVSVEQHAELHLSLYLEDGRIEDWLAYNGLIGLLSKQEIYYEMSKRGLVKQWEKDLKWCWFDDIEMRVDEIPEGWSPGRKPSLGLSMKGNRRGGRENLSPEVIEQKRKVMLERNTNNNPMGGKCWITNGTQSKVHLKSDPVPEGWRKGRVIKGSK